MAYGTHCINLLTSLCDPSVYHTSLCSFSLCNLLHFVSLFTPLSVGEEAELDANAGIAMGAAPQEGIVQARQGNEGPAPQSAASEEGGLVAAVVGMTVESQQGGVGAMDTEEAPPVAVAQEGSSTAPVEIEPFDMWSHKPVSYDGVGQVVGCHK